MPSDSRRNKKRPLASNNFLEALRDLGSGVTDSAVRDVAKGIPRTTFNQLVGKPAGEVKPNQPLELDKLAREKREAQRRERQAWGFQQEFLSLRRQEKIIWTEQEQKTKLQIEATLEELKKLAVSTKKLAQEVKIATQQAPVEPGVYHLSFFERLRQTIVLFRKRIDDSTTWLTAINQKSKKRNYYWAQVRKSGTKFMLSQERYMSTQMG